MPTAAVTTVPISPVCSVCGILKKSGRASCCGRGGSWFGKCARAASSNLDYTWYEGIRVCNAHNQVAMGQQLHASIPKSTASDDASMGIDPKAVIVAAHMFASTPVMTSRQMPVSTPTTVIANTSIITAARESIVSYASAVISKATTAESIAIVRNSVNISISKGIDRPGNGKIMKSTRSASAGMSITAREYEQLLQLVTRISTVLIAVSMVSG